MNKDEQIELWVGILSVADNAALKVENLYHGNAEFKERDALYSILLEFSSAVTTAEAELLNLGVQWWEPPILKPYTYKYEALKELSPKF